MAFHAAINKRQNQRVSESPLYYTTTEIKGFLPSGWVLLDGAAVAGRSGSGWTIRVLDIADTQWDLEVGSDQVARHGRLEALKRVVDRVYREALG